MKLYTKRKLMGATELKSVSNRFVFHHAFFNHELLRFVCINWLFRTKELWFGSGDIQVKHGFSAGKYFSQPYLITRVC